MIMKTTKHAICKWNCMKTVPVGGGGICVCFYCLIFFTVIATVDEIFHCESVVDKSIKFFTKFMRFFFKVRG